MPAQRTATERSGSTRTEEVFDQLRAELLDLNGGYQPGDRVKLAELTERFGVSISVVREALTRLAEQGLLVASPQRGFRVRELSVEDLADLTQVRVQIESLAFGQAVRNGDVAWETAIVATHHTLERTPAMLPDGKFNEGWSVVHRAFHQALLAGCGSPRLEEIATALRDSAELYRRWYWALADDRSRDIPAEHARLRDLAVSRDADAGIALLTEHIECAPRELIAYAERNDLTARRPAVD
ncbi:GntR family transcriptional regulator [Pseudonocardia eucalypti]|uniref:GntR family transcriptional regulator n=1 Tax=Pseudonocardia eucalypti TaxID=648755 RepID=A0ABP9QG92_9PSEU|nr:DNA-binding GntR family transcriptional regulator [Pseudonocardia eucalypti]